MFKAASHRRIPADGVAHYMESIWVRRVKIRAKDMNVTNLELFVGVVWGVRGGGV